MKTLSFILLISIFFMPRVGFGQSDLKVESDDLYFTSKDRKELNKKIALEEKRKAEELKNQATHIINLNPLMKVSMIFKIIKNNRILN